MTLVQHASALREYFRAVYRDPSVDAWSEAVLAQRWSELGWIYHTQTASLQMTVATDFHHAHPSSCEPADSTEQPGLIFCPTVKVRNIHWFGYWRPATTLVGGCASATQSPGLRAHGTLLSGQSVPTPSFAEDGAWLEVTRIATKVVTGPASVIRKFGEGGGHGCWFLAARGSGAFLHVGKSLRVHNRSELLEQLRFPAARASEIRKRNFFAEMDRTVEVRRSLSCRSAADPTTSRLIPMRRYHHAPRLIISSPSPPLQL